MTDCPFCQIMQNPEQINLVGETENFYAWLEYPQPRAQGHANIVPKEHKESVLEFSPKEYQEAMTLLREVMEKAMKGLEADGLSIAMNVKESGGQMLPHAYIQVFPRFEEDENAGTPVGAIFQHRDDLQTQKYFEETVEKMSSVDFSFETKTKEPHPDSQRHKEDNVHGESKEVEKEKVESSSEAPEDDKKTLEEEQEGRDDEVDFTKRGESIQWQ